MDEIEKLLFKQGYKCLCSGVDNKVTIFHSDEKYGNEISKYLSKTMNVNLRCFKIKYIKTFPLNESGKISYQNFHGNLP